MGQCAFDSEMTAAAHKGQTVEPCAQQKLQLRQGSAKLTPAEQKFQACRAHAARVGVQAERKAETPQLSSGNRLNCGGCPGIWCRARHVHCGIACPCLQQMYHCVCV